MMFVLRSAGCRFVANLGTVRRFFCTNHQNIYGMSCLKSSDSLEMARLQKMEWYWVRGVRTHTEPHRGILTSGEGEVVGRF
jgi:hypothetical protein